MSGMSHVELDHQGRLTYFETIPAQQLDTPTHAAPIDWTPLFTLAGLDLAQLKGAEPLWNWLAASDTRAAWTGTWPDSGRPLRVEAAALGGRPVAFMVAGPWRKPWRMTEASDNRDTVIVMVLFAITFGILGGAGYLARKNLLSGRGDLQGATRLGVCMAAVLMAVWFCKVHLVGSIGLLAMFLIAVCTSVFYGVLMWTIYVALEPYVRKHWPQVLVSWTNLLAGRVADPVVGRDVLLGAALGVVWALLVRVVDSWSGERELMGYPGATELLMGMRSTVGLILQGVPYAHAERTLLFLSSFHCCAWFSGASGPPPPRSPVCSHFLALSATTATRGSTRRWPSSILEVARWSCSGGDFFHMPSASSSASCCSNCLPRSTLRRGTSGTC